MEIIRSHVRYGGRAQNERLYAQTRSKYFQMYYMSICVITHRRPSQSLSYAEVCLISFLVRCSFSLRQPDGACHSTACLSEITSVAHAVAKISVTFEINATLFDQTKSFKLGQQQVSDIRIMTIVDFPLDNRLKRRRNACFCF